MIYSRDRNEMRGFFTGIWEKYRKSLPLEPLEHLIAEVIVTHPEYQALLETPEAALARDYFPESGQSNPFLHMGMHIALREQLAADRPAGIVAIHRTLLLQRQDNHEVEHCMAECLGETLWRAQRDNAQPDETAYLGCLQKLTD